MITKSSKMNRPMTTAEDTGCAEDTHSRAGDAVTNTTNLPVHSPMNSWNDQSSLRGGLLGGAALGLA
jgi:hypothetical protein